MKEIIIIKSGENPDLEKIWMEKAQTKMARFHPNRLKEWVNGRVALTIAFKTVQIDIGPSDEFLGYQQIKGHEDYSFSISHTGIWAGALLIKGNQRPGLDIEGKNREVDDKVLERFTHPDDHNLDPLLLWSVKEAAYKTLSKEIQEKIWLQSIQVGAGTFSGAGFSGNWKKCDHPELMVVEATRLA